MPHDPSGTVSCGGARTDFSRRAHGHHPAPAAGRARPGVWIDYLSRPFVKDGDLEGLIREGIVGATSNPTIFQAAIAEGDAYDDQIRELVDAGTTEPKDIFLELARDDIRDACDLFKSVWDEGDGKDGWVSLEVDPNLAHDTQGTIDEAKRLHAMVERDNLLIKIPATRRGPRRRSRRRSPPASRSTSR